MDIKTYLCTIVDVEEGTESVVVLDDEEKLIALVRDLDKEKYQLESVQIIHSPVHYNVDFFVKKGIDGLETGETTGR